MGEESIDQNMPPVSEYRCYAMSVVSKKNWF